MVTPKHTGVLGNSSKRKHDRKFCGTVRTKHREPAHSSWHHPQRIDRRSRPGLRHRQRRTEVRSRHPSDQFKNEKGEIEVVVGETVEVALDSVEDGSGETRLSREKAKRAAPGRASRRPSRSRRSSSASSPAASRAASPSRSTTCARSCRARWSMCVRCAIRRTSRTSRSNSRSSSSIRSATTSWSRAARWSNRSTAPSVPRCSTTCRKARPVKGVVKNLTDYGAFVDLGGIDGLLHITDMAWKRVKHPSEVVKVGEEIDVRILKFDRERSARLAGPEAAGRRSVAEHRAPLSGQHARCSARSPTSPTTAASSRSRRASRAWCTCRKWTGPTRTSIPPRSCTSARKSKSWCSTSTRSGAASAWA
jgi:predicted RNA-binding protein with RPS1 domain